jgi:diguanylate cyclase (GGDEF)-like protein
VLIDVDDFKAINDQYGHAVGDSALREIARGLLRTVRGSDTVVRYGGDEFAIIAPESDLAELTGLMDRVVETVRSASVVAQDGSRVPLSVSVGGSVADGAEIEGPITTDALLAAADRALYGAKRDGKDRAALPAAYPASA